MHPRTLNLYPIDYPFETLVTRIGATPSKLILNPDFQRKYKWDKKGWERASKFIESCLMRIPLPSCYFAEDPEGRHIVIDGVQRLTTIAKFFRDEFALEGLTTFKDLEGKRYSELGPYQSELDATTIRCIVLRKENPQELIREIFSRLNQGAVTLSDQEIRHALYPGPFDELLSRLATIDDIKKFASGPDSVKDSREAEELVLRFFAFQGKLGKLDRLSKFLDEFMELNQTTPAKEIARMEALFRKSLANCLTVFGDKVFRNTAKKRTRQSIVYYDLLMHTLGSLSDNLVLRKKTNIQRAFTKLCNSAAFKRTLSGGLQNKTFIEKRRTIWMSLLQDAIK
jgi:hypothetical protein